MATVKLPKAPKNRLRLAVKSGNGATKQNYCVADIKLADLGRREIGVAEHEMPGLMSVRAKYGSQKPLTVCAYPAHCT